METLNYRAEHRLIQRSSLRYVFPPMLGMLFAQCAPVVDSVCASNFIGTEALSAIVTTQPFNYALNVIAALGGIGGGVIISRCSGAGEKEKAGRVFTRAIIMMVGAAILLTALSVLFMDPLLRAFCATEDNFAYARDYATVMMYGSVFIVLNIAGDYILANDNNVKLATIGDIVGAVVNVIIDVVGCYFFHGGIKVIAFGTAFGSFCCCLVYLLHFRKKDRLCRFVFPMRKDGDPLPHEIVKPGSAEALMYFFFIIQILAHNYVLRDDGGTAGLGNSAIIENLMLVFTILIAGASDAIYPMASAYNGEQNRSGMLMVRRTLVRIGFLLLVLPVVLICAFPQIMIVPFHVVDPVMLQTLPRALRIVCVTCLILVINTTMIDYLSAVEEEKKANLAFLLQMAVEVPLTLLLNRWIYMDAPWYAGLAAQIAVMVYLFLFSGHLTIGTRRYRRENLLLLDGGIINPVWFEQIETEAEEILSREQLNLVKNKMLMPLLAALPEGRNPRGSFTILERDDGRKTVLLRYVSKTDYLENNEAMPEIESEEDDDDDAEETVPFDTCIRSEFLGLRRLMIVLDENNTSDRRC